MTCAHIVHLCATPDVWASNIARDKDCSQIQRGCRSRAVGGLHKGHASPCQMQGARALTCIPVPGISKPEPLPKPVLKRRVYTVCCIELPCTGHQKRLQKMLCLAFSFLVRLRSQMQTLIGHRSPKNSRNTRWIARPGTRIPTSEALPIVFFNAIQVSERAKKCAPKQMSSQKVPT